jgi:hypothetical protein
MLHPFRSRMSVVEIQKRSQCTRDQLNVGRQYPTGHRHRIRLTNGSSHHRSITRLPATWSGRYGSYELAPTSAGAIRAASSSMGDAAGVHRRTQPTAIRICAPTIRLCAPTDPLRHRTIEAHHDGIVEPVIKWHCVCVGVGLYGLRLGHCRPRSAG